MSVMEYKTFISEVRTSLLNEIKNLDYVQMWFDRIITLELLQKKGIIPPFENYQKEEVINACILENQYFPGVFNDNIESLINTFPHSFYSSSMILKMNANINKDTDVSVIATYQEDFKDHERYTDFIIENRNLSTNVNDKNITALTQIFTPKWICEYFVNNTINKKCLNYKDLENITILDPCLGTGQILYSALQSLIKLYQKYTSYSIDQIIEKIYNNQLYGFDIDSHAITLAKFIFLLKSYELCPKLLNNPTRLKLNFINIKNYNFKTINNQILRLQSYFQKTSFIGSLITLPSTDYKKMLSSSLTEEEYEMVYTAYLLTKKYDIVLTNPPYMGRKILPKELLKYLNTNFKYGKSELYAAFIEKCLTFSKPDGYLGMITLHTWMFIKSFAELRKYILSNYQIESLLHLGKNTFENLNAYNALASAFIIKNQIVNKPITFVNLTTYDDIHQKEQAYLNNENIFKVCKENLLKLDNYQFLYWLSDSELKTLLNSPKLGQYATIRQGLATGDNQKYIRQFQEIDISDVGFNCSSIDDFFHSNKKYAPYNKGGDQTKWYSTSKCVIKFDKKAYEILKTVGNHLPSKEYYFKEGITWSLFGFNSFNVRYKEQGYVFDVSGSSLFTSKELEKYILAYLSSNVAFYYLSSIAPTVNFQVGNIASLPFIINNEYIAFINDIVDKLIKYAKYYDQQDELSWNFKQHDLLVTYDKNISFNDNLNKYISKLVDINKKIEEAELELNKIFNIIYNINVDPKPNIVKIIPTKKEIVKQLISNLIGIVFGRYSLSGYSIKINNEDYVDITEVVKELKVVIQKCLSNSALGEIEKILSYSIDEYIVKYFGKEHIKKYQKLPIYWYKRLNGKILIGYYHTLKMFTAKDKEEGIKINYLKNDLLYNIKN